MLSQLICSGCRTVLLYPRGGPNVCCAICNVVTPVPPSAMEMAQLICGGCRTLLMHPQGASSIRCSCSHLTNLVPAAASNIVAHVSCGNCHAMLMYPAGAPSIGDRRILIPADGLPVSVSASASASTSSTSMGMSRPQNQTVIIQNPMTLNESGKLVRNVIVGVTT